MAEIKQIPYLTLKIQGQGHDESRPKSNQVIYGSGPRIRPKWRKSQKLFISYRVNSNLRPPAAVACETVQKHKATPVYRDDLIKTCNLLVLFSNWISTFPTFFNRTLPLS